MNGNKNGLNEIKNVEICLNKNNDEIRENVNNNEDVIDITPKLIQNLSNKGSIMQKFKNIQEILIENKNNCSFKKEKEKDDNIDMNKDSSIVKDSSDNQEQVNEDEDILN